MQANQTGLLDKKGRVTVEELKAMERFKHLTDAEAAELLESIEKFCEVAYSIWKRREQTAQSHNKVIEITPPLKQAA